MRPQIQKRDSGNETAEKRQKIRNRDNKFRNETANLETRQQIRKQDKK